MIFSNSFRYRGHNSNMFAFGKDQYMTSYFSIRGPTGLGLSRMPDTNHCNSLFCFSTPLSNSPSRVSTAHPSSITINRDSTAPRTHDLTIRLRPASTINNRRVLLNILITLSLLFILGLISTIVGSIYLNETIIKSLPSSHSSSVSSSSSSSLSRSFSYSHPNSDVNYHLKKNSEKSQNENRNHLLCIMAIVCGTIMLVSSGMLLRILLCKRKWMSVSRRHHRLHASPSQPTPSQPVSSSGSSSVTAVAAAALSHQFDELYYASSSGIPAAAAASNTVFPRKAFPVTRTSLANILHEVSPPNYHEVSQVSFQPPGYSEVISEVSQSTPTQTPRQTPRQSSPVVVATLNNEVSPTTAVYPLLSGYSVSKEPNEKVRISAQPLTTETKSCMISLNVEVQKKVKENDEERNNVNTNKRLPNNNDGKESGSSSSQSETSYVHVSPPIDAKVQRLKSTSTSSSCSNSSQSTYTNPKLIHSTNKKDQLKKTKSINV